MKSIKYIFLAIFLLAIAVGRIEPVLAVEYQHLGAMPAYPSPEIKDSESWFIYNLKPGDSKEDAVVVMNTYDRPYDVRVYAADTTTSSDGGYALKQYAEEKTSVGGWIRFYNKNIPDAYTDVFESLDKKILATCSLSREDMQDLMGKKKLVGDEDWDDLKKWCEGEQNIILSIKQDQKINVPFVIRIPDSLDVGDHTGGILIEKSVPEDMGTNENGSAVRLTTRLGVRVYENVPGTVVKKLGLKAFSLNKNYREFDYSSWFGKTDVSEMATLRTTVDNSASNASVGFTEKLVIENLISGDKQENEERSFQVLRGDEFSYAFDYKTPRFGYFSFYNEISFADADGTTQKLKTEVLKMLIFPWREFVVAFVVIFIGLLAYVAKIYHYRKKYNIKNWVSYEVVADDDLQQIALHHGIQWKILAKQNSLRPPYILTAKQKILVPNSVSTPSDGAKKNVKATETVKSAEYAALAWIILGVTVLVGVALWMTVLFSTDKKETNEKNNSSKKVETVKKSKEPNVPAVASSTEKSEDRGTVKGGNLTDENKKTGETSSEKKSNESSGNISKKEVGIVILNAGAPSGSAKKLSDQLLKASYGIKGVKNATQEQASVIMYQSGYFEIAKELSEEEAVKIYNVKLRQDDNFVKEQEAPVVIILGS